MTRDKTDRLLGSIRGKRTSEPRNTLGTGNMYLPNNSGDHQKSIKRNIPIQDMDLANKAYADKVEILTADPASPEEGRLIINSITNTMKLFYNGSWQTLHSFGDSFLLQEIGDNILLETGDNIILEA